MTSLIVEYLVNYILFSYIDIFIVAFFEYTTENDGPIWGFLEELSTYILDE